jgi:Ca2+-binding RTX toxin-like protein
VARYSGIAGNDTQAGAQYEADVFSGFGAGTDKIEGGALNDTFYLTVDENTDYIYGGLGEDRIDYSRSDRGLTIDLAHDTVSAVFYDSVLNGGTHTAVVADLNSIEDVVGSIFSDRIIGSDADNVLEGGRGADFIDGGRGMNTASYAHSSAAVEINLNNVLQHGGDAEGDQLYHIANVIGSSYNDVLTGNSADNTLDGGAGFDRAVYAGAAEGISVSLAAGTVTGGASIGTDTLRGIEAVQGSNFIDKYDAAGFTATSTNGGADQGNFNEFEGLGGNDLIIGNGDTRISYLHATHGVAVDIQAGVAIGDASVGTDTFKGVNNVRGSDFGDTLLGSNNDPGTTEKFEGRGGDDYIDGRGGFDLAIYNHDPATASGIHVNLAAGIVQGDATVGTDTLRSIEAVRGTDLADTFDATGFGAGSTNGGSVGTLNQFEGMGGDDTITGNGNTRIVFFNATSGVNVNLASHTADGDASVGHDTFSGVNAVTGSAFADTITASGSNDTLTGGNGADTFVFSSFTWSGSWTPQTQNHTVTDFSAGDAPGHDVIELQHTSFADFASVQAAAQQVGSDVVISLNPHDTVTLSGVDFHALTASDFHLV